MRAFLAVLLLTLCAGVAAQTFNGPPVVEYPTSAGANVCIDPIKGGGYLTTTGCTASGGGNVSTYGTPVAGNLAEWTDATHIEGVTALPSGTTATTPSYYDISTKVATTASTYAQVRASMATMSFTLPYGGTFSFNSQGTGASVLTTVSGGVITGISSVLAPGSGYAVGDLLTLPSGNYDNVLEVATLSGSGIATVNVLNGGTGNTGPFSGGVVINASTYAFTVHIAGTLTANTTLIMTGGSLLTTSNQWIVYNNTTGPYTLTVCVAPNATTNSCASGGSTTVVPQGSSNSAPAFIETDGILNVNCAAGSCLTSGVTAGTYGSATQVAQVTVNAQGQVTAASNVNISVSSGSTITSGTYASLPSSPGAGQMYIVTDGPATMLYQSGAWQTLYQNMPVTPYIDANFSWVNQTSSSKSGSVTATGPFSFLRAPALSGDNMRIRVASLPATPWTFTALMQFPFMGEAYIQGGMILRNSSSGEILTLAAVQSLSSGDNLYEIALGKWSSPTSSASNYILQPGFITPQFWGRIQDNGTNRIYSVSYDGQNWMTLYTVSDTDYITPNQFGFYADSNNSGGFDSGILIISETLTTP